MDQTPDTPGLMGWGEESQDDFTRLDNERANLHQAQDEHPVAFCRRAPKQIGSAIREKLVEEHSNAAQGLDESGNGIAVYTRNRRSSWSHNMTLSGTCVVGGQPMDDFVLLRSIYPVLFGQMPYWMAQIIGSCVASGWMRAVGTRILWEIAALGESEEPIGDKRLGFDSLMPFAPFNYGVGRRLGNMRGGDGSYCSVQIKGHQRYGMIPCSAAALRPVVGSRETDYPEPQNSRLYREFGNHKHLNRLQPHATFPLLESEDVNSGGRLVEAIGEDYKPLMVCSNWAFKPMRDVRQGDRLVEVWNQWGRNSHRNGTVFYILEEEANDWARGNSSMMTIGDIDLLDSTMKAW